jgi:ABC-type multidrug transport system fused ATPase/permease subunit
MNIPLKRYWNLLVTYLRPQRGKVTGLAALLLISIALQLTIPQLLRSFIDTSRAGSPLELLVYGALIFLGTVILKHIVTIAATYVSQDIGWNATNALRADLGKHCLELDMSFHTSRTPGELIERIDGDIQVLSNFFSQLVLVVVNNGLLLIGVLILLGIEDWRVGLAFTAFTALAMFVLYNIRGLATREWQEASQARADLFGFFEERVSGTVDLRANNATGYAIWRLLGLLRTNYRADIRGWIKTATLRNIMISVFVLGSTLALGFGIYLSLSGTVTIGTVYLIYAYTLLLFQPLERITKELEDLQAASASITRIEELFQIRSQIPDEGVTPLPAGPLAVEFQHISFGYDPATPVLHDLSFELPPGTTLGLLGRTGSGKTSITRLLTRLYEPQQGQILLGGIDVRAVPIADLRQRIGIVTQDVHLFQASLRDNLTFFDDSISDAQILQALEQVGLQPWLEALPDGLDTQLQAGGGGLSAGQAQLLAFARVFLKDPGLVILDEASSRLDAATQHQIEQAVQRLLHNRTGIIIAHRLETLQHVDEIMIMRDGAISEQGARDAMALDANSRFAQLLRTGLEEALT